MPLDAQTKALLEQMEASGAPPLYELSVSEARAAFKEMTISMDVPKTEVYRRDERTLTGPNGDITVRIYWPRAVTEGERLPVLLLYHGGGFSLGNLDTHENMARYYCRGAEVIVVNVGYRLSPEHKFPEGVEDCYAALCWVADHIDDIDGDPARIAVTGDSAGGNICAVTCQLTKARNGPAIAFQALVYPVVTLDVEADYESRREFSTGEYFFSVRDMEWLTDLYFDNSEDQIRDLRCAPNLAEDLSGLAPALVVTAGFDPLRDEGQHYADRLVQAGVPVEYRCFDSTIHGFMSFSGAIEAGKEGLKLVAARVRKALRS